MIKNVIFDFGQVLVYFQPEYMCSVYTDNKDDIKLLSEVVFDRLYWERLDAGTIEDEEMMKDVKKRLPERLHEVADKIYYNWIYNLPEIEGMREVISLCRERGFGLYILSNISTYFAAHQDEIPILSLFDGYVFSSLSGAVKPNREIFAHITEKFSLTPSETLFVDDNISNIGGARDFGINAYHFDGDAKKLYSYIESVGKN
ncbi:MAG: HAD family phosphatase [Clostridia bacterium]|nr:HAD family phosphatase [Clostridia bacterium]